MRRSIIHSKWPLFLAAIVALCAIGASAPALAADAGAGEVTFNVLNRIDAAYKPLQNTWYTAIRVYAERLFWLLVLVDMGWSGTVYALEKNDVAEIVVSLTKKIFPIGFFWALLKFSDSWIPAIINSFAKIGREAGGAGVATATPDGIASLGFELAKGCFVVIRNLSLMDSLAVVFPVTLMAIVTFLCFLWVAGQLLVTLIETYVCVGGGVILLGFGGSRWTTDFATKYLQYAVGTGLKLMILYLIVGTGQTLLGSNLVIETEHLVESTLAAMGGALVYAYLAINVPKIASGMMSGSPALTAGDMMTSALAMGAAVAGVGAMASGGLQQTAGAAGGAAAGAGGLAKALGAGYSSALDAGKSGVGAATGAVGEVAKHSLGLAAGGIGDAIKSGADSFSDKVANSTGGQIASSIEATRGGSMSGAAPASSTAAPSSAPATAAGSSPSASVSSPASSGVSAASGPSGTSPAASAPAAATASSAPTGSGSAPVSTPTGSANASTTGDASSASIGPGSSVPPPTDTGNPGQQKAPLHDRIRDLQGFVPQDMAPASSINIQAGHTVD